jgi:hypothetical protein
MADPSGPARLPEVARVYFGHVSTKVILASLIPLLAVRVAVGGWSRWDLGIVLLAIVVWPFFEWVFHWAIHLRPLRIAGVTLDTFAAREHRLHPVTPPVVDHILLPPRALVVMAVASISGFWLLLGLERGLTAAACFHLGGLANGWVHFLTHTRYPPRTRFFRWVRRTHALHHFANEGYWFAFTGPFVDVLFRTHRDPRAVPVSAACMAWRRTHGDRAEGSAFPHQPTDPAGA